MRRKTKSTFATSAACATYLLLIGYQSQSAVTEHSQKKKNEAAAPASLFLHGVQEKYKNVQTISADFSQKQTNAALGTTKETSGQILIKRPNKFRWDTKAPENERSLLVGNGKKVWFYKPPFRAEEHGQVLIRDATDVQSQLAIELLAGRIDAKKQFSSKRLAEGHVELKPLRPAGDIERIELFIERPTNLVYKLKLFTGTGNETELVLKNVKLGLKLDDSLFNFKAPPKTEEIY